MAYATKLRELEDYGIAVEILEEMKLREIGMSGLLAVGQGSVRPSAVVLLHWNNAVEGTPPIVVVGKGVCFDSA